MRVAIAMPTSGPQRISLAGLRLAWHGRLRVISIGFAAAVFATLIPDVTNAGTIVGFSTGLSNWPASDEFGSFSGDDSNPGADTASPATPQERPEPREQEVPQIDPDADLAGGGTTSSPAPSGGTVAPAVLAAATLEVASSSDVRRIRLQEDLALDSPSPLGLLDPPKA